MQVKYKHLSCSPSADTRCDRSHRPALEDVLGTRLFFQELEEVKKSGEEKGRSRVCLLFVCSCCYFRTFNCPVSAGPFQLEPSPTSHLGSRPMLRGGRLGETLLFHNTDHAHPGWRLPPGPPIASFAVLTLALCLPTQKGCLQDDAVQLPGQTSMCQWIHIFESAGAPQLPLCSPCHGAAHS